MLEKMFRFEESGTNLRTEVVGGVTTFMTMAYIIFVQPAVLKETGMDFGAVMVATCIASAFATILLGFLANYPIAQAPAMGHNFFFVYTVCLGMGISWQMALGANFISGCLFLLFLIFGFQKVLIKAIPDSLKHGISAGIGLLIGVIGFRWAGLLGPKMSLASIGDFTSTPVLISITATLLIAVLMVLRVKGAILWGILYGVVVALATGLVKFEGIVDTPPSLAPTFLKLKIGGFENLTDILIIIFVFFFLDLFDTVGTLVGVAQPAGFMKNGDLPKATQAMFSDAAGTVSGTLLGTSTVTSYIESSAGISQGARTGLANIVTGLLFLGALFFHPLVKMIGGGVEIEPGVFHYPIIAPALIVVGSLMIPVVARIKWDELAEAIPAYLTIITMFLTFSITEGIAFGFITYSILKLVSGKGREVHPVVYVFSALFLIRYLFV